jgi:hypothetical protein
MKVLLMMMALPLLNLATLAWLNGESCVRILALWQQLAVFKRKPVLPRLVAGRDLDLTAVLKV